MIRLDNQTNADMPYLIEGDQVFKPQGVISHLSVDTVDDPVAEVYFKISFWNEIREGLPVASVLNVAANTHVIIRQDGSGGFSATKS